MRRVYAILFCFLVVFSVFSALNIVEAQSPSGNITFQENSIPDVNVYYQDYSFVFEYKSFFIRVRPFVIYNGSYYGMKKIVTWIKNNYPDVNYKWLVDKAVNAIHYGFNLTKLPPSVAEKIDYLGFRLVDLNFPLSWFELEELMVDINEKGELIEPYNITRIHIPKANLVFSFEDLYPQGYSLQHINSTYILIGGVKGKTDLIVDPITFSSPIITVIGGTEGSPLDFKDIWDADQAGGWNVVINNNNTNTQFEFNARIVLGNGTVAGTTWFADTSKQIVFTSLAFSASLQKTIEVLAEATLRFGTLISETNKRTINGVAMSIFVNQHVHAIYAPYGTTFLYSCFFDSDYTGTNLRNIYGRALKIYNSLLNGYDLDDIRTPDGSIYNVITVDANTGIDSSTASIDKVTIYDATYAFYLYYTMAFSASNIIGRNNTYAFYGMHLSGDKYLINVDFDTWNILWSGTNLGGKVYRQYEFDLTVTDDAGTALENANVTITHYGQSETEDFNGLTDASGQISTQTLSRSFYNQTGGDTEYSHNPFNLNIVLTDYETYNQNFTLSEKTDWTIALLDKVVTTTDPVARFEFSPERPYVDETITFDATNSTDPDGGTIDSYSWSWGDGEADGSGVTDTHSYSSAGEYSVELTVTDDESATDSTILKVNVTDYYSPVAAFEFSPERPYINEEITFDATNSSAVQGTITSYSWTFGDGNSSSGVSATNTYVSEGKFLVTLTVTNSHSKTDTITQYVNVTDYASPTARFTFTPSNPEQNEDITFDGTSSSDSDGIISSYSWTFGDGTTSTSSTATKNYESEDTFTVTLTVTDSQAKTDSTTQTIIVQNPPPPSDGGAGPAPGTTPPPIPIDTSGIALLLSWGPNAITYYPYFDHNYIMNFTVTNNATEDQAVTVLYWLNDGANQTVWENTHSFLMYASSELVLTLTYPISKDGSYTAYAQVIAPDPDGQIQSSQFTATSGLTLLVIFFIIIVGTILALAIIKVETSKKKGEVSV